MKIIDLLNKIANGEQPKTIKYYDTIYNFEEYKGDWGYVNKEYGKYKWFAKKIDCDLSNCLNDEVEIIEEDKKIEKIDNVYYYKTQTEQNQIFKNKINEIIDYLMENKQ